MDLWGLFDWSTNTIETNDTLSKIARECNTRYGTNYDAYDLQLLNEDTISNVDLIFAGNHLNLGDAEVIQTRAIDYVTRATTKYTIEQVTPPKKQTTNSHVLQGMGGAIEMGIGVLGYIGVTAYGITEEATMFSVSGQLNPSVGYSMLSGYSLSSVVFADGVNLLSSAIKGRTKKGVKHK